MDNDGNEETEGKKETKKNHIKNQSSAEKTSKAFTKVSN